MQSLDFIGYRLRRAMEHVQLLNQEISDFLQTDDNKPIHDRDSEPGYLLVKMRPSPLPASFSLYIGEALYQFRAALNNLSCELAKANTKHVNDTTEFPIFDDRCAFGTLGDPKSGNFKKIGQLSATHQAVIESEQPFMKRPRSPRRDPHWALYVLSNADRHKAPELTNVTVRWAGTNFSPPQAAASYHLMRSRLGPFKRETEVARYGIAHRGPALDVHVESIVQLDIAFDRAGELKGVGRRRVLFTLGDIGMRVAEIVGELA